MGSALEVGVPRWLCAEPDGNSEGRHPFGNRDSLTEITRLAVVPLQVSDGAARSRVLSETARAALEPAQASLFSTVTRAPGLEAGA